MEKKNLLLRPIRRSPVIIERELKDCLMWLRRDNMSGKARTLLMKRVEQLQKELGICKKTNRQS